MKHMEIMYIVVPELLHVFVVGQPPPPFFFNAWVPVSPPPHSPPMHGSQSPPPPRPSLPISSNALVLVSPTALTNCKMCCQGNLVEGEGPDAEAVSVLHSRDVVQFLRHLLMVYVRGSACRMGRGHMRVTWLSHDHWSTYMYSSTGVVFIVSRKHCALEF